MATIVVTAVIAGLVGGGAHVRRNGVLRGAGVTGRGARVPAVLPLLVAHAVDDAPVF
jgi:hypothetical protein